MDNIDLMSESKVVYKEIPLSITQEKFKNCLVKSYDVGWENSKRKKWFDYYGLSLSGSASLLMVLITSNFNDILFIKSNIVKVIAWIVFGILIAYSLISLVYISKFKDDKTERDIKEKEVYNIMLNCDGREVSNKP